MSPSVVLKREGGDREVVRYVSGPGAPVRSVVLRAAALPDPPPETITISVEWTAAVTHEAEAIRPRRRSQKAATPVGQRSGTVQEIHNGDQVTVVKSRVSGVKSPPEWLEQYLGRTGVVLWTTPDGAEVDLGTDTAWFSFSELVLKE